VAAKVPAAGAQDNVRYGGKFQLNADGSAELELEQSFFGKYAMGLRNALSEIPEEQLRDVLESRLLGPELRGPELKSYALDHFDDLDSPLIIRAKARIPAFAQRSGDMLLIAPPFGPRVSQLAALPQRQTPLLMAEATHREINLRLDTRFDFEARDMGAIRNLALERVADIKKPVGRKPGIKRKCIQAVERNFGDQSLRTMQRSEIGDNVVPLAFQVERVELSHLVRDQPALQIPTVGNIHRVREILRRENPFDPIIRRLFG